MTPAPSPQPLVALLVAARRGDQQARDDLLRALHPTVRRWMRARYRDAEPDTVDDLVQEGMLRLATRWAGCRATSDKELYRWTSRTVRSAALNYFGARPNDAGEGRRTVPLDAIDETRVADPDGYDGHITVRGVPDCRALADRIATPAPDAADVRHALYRVMADAYASLPVATQELLWHRLVEGAGWTELGRRLGTSGAAVKRRFERACARLGTSIRARVSAHADERRGNGRRGGERR